MPSVRAAEVYRHNLHEYWASEVHDCYSCPGAMYGTATAELMIEAGAFIMCKLKLVNDTAEQTIHYTNGLVVN